MDSPSGAPVATEPLEPPGGPSPSSLPKLRPIGPSAKPLSFDTSVFGFRGLLACDAPGACGGERASEARVFGLQPRGGKSERAGVHAARRSRPSRPPFPCACS
eukprot:363611-Chlamydomonas_euryale.AAC.5